MPLPTHRISIFKKLGAEVWSNDWLVNRVDMDAAASLGNSLVNFEQRLHGARVMFEYVLIATMSEGDRVFRHTPINLPGLQATAVGAMLPLFNTIRMDMATTDSDPCRKYFRMPIEEGNQEEGILNPATITSLNGFVTTYLNPIIALNAIVSGRGNLVTSATFARAIQMRQLHRRKRKKILVGGILV